MQFRHAKSYGRFAAIVFAVALLLPIVSGAVESDPLATDKVFLEHSDRLSKADYTTDEIGDYQVLSGNVRMRKQGMVMTCDSAHFYEGANSFEAFGNVKMEQGDTLFVYGDRLFYDGAEELATLSGDPGKLVKLINRDVTLTSYIFYYDMTTGVGYYDNHGTLTDPQNRLESIVGEYSTRDKNAWFFYDVELNGINENGDSTRLNTDSLNYNTITKIAQIMAPSVITNSDGVIYSSSGTYNTYTGQADLYSRSTVKTNRGSALTGDTLHFDRQTGIGEAFGNIILSDSVRQTSLQGDYGYYNDMLDSAFVTGRAVAKEYSQGDTLYIHGDTINAYIEIAGIDSTRVTNVFHKVRMFRSDMQGVCDSLSATDSDSLLRMYRHPVLWSGERQIYGNVIYVHFNDSTADKAMLPEGGMMSEYIAEDCYNQLTGSDVTAYFNDSSIRRLTINGNVQMILFPMEKDSTYNKYIYLESSTMDAWFENQKIEKINFEPLTTYDVTPLFLAKRNAYTLQGFKDYSDIRPTSPEDIFIIPQKMIEMIEAAEIKPASLRKSKTAKSSTPKPPEKETGESVPEEKEPVTDETE